MKVVDIINASKKTMFSFEILPPLKGNGIDGVFDIVDSLMEYDPKFINITSHREQYNDKFKKVRNRPGTVAIAAALKNRYDITVIPHILCGGFTRRETEYVLIDLDYLGIDNILTLRGDALKNEKFYRPEEDGNIHAQDLVRQVQDMNKGKYLDDDTYGLSHKTSFSCGVAGYPEKHHLAPTIEFDINFLKQKVEAGADYIVTQMFFDNSKYYEFVDLCRKEGINIPIIPGIKPLGLKNQVNILPNLFHVDIPEQLKNEINRCKDDAQAKQVGTEWAIMQSKDLIKNNVPIVHIYTYGMTQQIKTIAKEVF
jgi:methylenetetrahydrofolate reductase (NADPH)